MRDKRQFSRIPFRRPLDLNSGTREQFKGAAGCDVSKGGLRIRSEQFLPLGATVRVRFQLPNDELIVLSGHVAWVQKEPFGDFYQIGVMFQDDSSNLYHRKRLGDFMDNGGI